MFGVTSTTKRDSSETIAISAILWIPIFLCVLFAYKIISFIFNNFKFIDIELETISKLSDLNKMADSIWFLIFYF
ncbi:hypothetical protein CHH69_18800, partial [Terribacillus saccharophilus]